MSANLATMSGNDRLTRGQLAALWDVSPKTLSRWEKEGKHGVLLRRAPTMGHPRYLIADVKAFADAVIAAELEETEPNAPKE